jgi:hypothetical protein
MHEMFTLMEQNFLSTHRRSPEVQKECMYAKVKKGRGCGGYLHYEEHFGECISKQKKGFGVKI